MATKLLELEFGDSIKSITQLKNEAKELKGIFEGAAEGTEDFVKASTGLKTVNSELKRLTDQAKANSNALGGINQSAKFTDNSLGKLKQQIKENDAQLLKLNTSGKLFKALQQEQAVAIQKRIDVEKKLPSLFQERIKGAIDETNTLKGLKQAIKDYTDLTIQGAEGAAEKLAELKDKLEDVQDSTKSLKGSGVEALTNSVGLLREGFANFDSDKISLAFDGVGSAMKAIPIFAVIEGVKLLIDNFDDVVKFFKGFTDSAKEVKKLEFEVAALNRTSEKQKTNLQNTINIQEASIELAKAQNKSTSEINASEQQLFETKVKLIKVEIEQIKGSIALDRARVREIQDNDSLNESYLELISTIARKTGDEKTADNIDKTIQAAKITRGKETLDQLTEDTKKLSELENSLVTLSIQNETKIVENKKEAAERRKEINDFLTQQDINAIKDSYTRSIEQSKFDEQTALRDAKKFLKNKELFEQAKTDIEAKFLEDRRLINAEAIKKNQEEEISLLQSGLEAKQNIGLKTFEDERAIAKAQQDIILNDQASTYEQRIEAQTTFNNTIHDINKAEVQRNLEDSIILNELKIQNDQFNLETQFEARQEILNAQRELELHEAEGNEVKKLEIQKKFANEQILLEKDIQEQKLALKSSEIEFSRLAANTLINITSLVSADSKQQQQLAKTAALFNIAASEAQAIAGLLAISFAPTPGNLNPLAPYIKFAAGLVAITTNAIQAKNILQSFEEGGYTGDGNPHEVSTALGTKSYTYHKKEYVTPNRVLATPKGAALVSELEAMRKGISNPSPWIGGMFDGGFTARSASSNADATFSNRNFMNDFISKLPAPVLQISELRKVESSNNKAVNIGGL